MDYVTLRRAGGSLTLTIPSGMVRLLGLNEGSRVGVSVRGGKLIAEPAGPAKPRYTLEELLSQCDPDAPLSDEDRAWLTDGPTGSEVL